MTQEDQQSVFEQELENLIDRFVSEFDLTLASALGVIDIVKYRMYLESAYDDKLESDSDENGSV